MQPEDSNQPELPASLLSAAGGDDSPTVHPSTTAGSSTPAAVVLDLGGGAPASTLPDDKTVISQRPPAGDAAPPALVTPQHIGQSLVGKRLEHYELVEFVGGGGMGAVFRATDSRLGRTVAVKVLSRDQTDEETIRRFRNEAQSAARLDHPNIARVYYVGEDHGWNFIVFEFIEGVNLRDVIAGSGPLPLADALSYTIQVAEALAHSSSRDVIHRDIKPSNVLVTADRSVKLVDMGLARLHQVESSSHELTASGVTLGTFDYISPEQARDPRVADVRSDIYSLGCTLYYMLTSRPPFPDGTALQKLIRHSSEEPDDVRALRPELHAKVSALLARMLAKKPSQRQQSAQELVSDIAALADQLGLSGVVGGQVLVTRAPPTGQILSKAVQVIVAAAVLLVGIFAVDAWLPRSASRTELAMRPRLQPAAGAPVEQATASGPEVATTSGGQSVPVGEPPDQPFVPAVAAGSAGQGGGTAATFPSSAVPAGLVVVRPTESVDDDADSALAGLGSPPDLDTIAAIGPPPLAGEIGLTADERIAVSLRAPPIAPATSAAKIKRLVVVRQLPAETVPERAAETEYCTSLAAACLRAAELGLSEIELAWTGPLVETSLEVAHARLTWRAVAGYRPAVVFRPQVSDSASKRQMIRLAGGPSSGLSIVGVDLRLELPPESSAGWSLLALRPGQNLELSNCVLTVQDGYATRPPAHQQVAMISVVPRMTTETMSMEPSTGMAASTTIRISGTIARGEATLVSLAEDTPLSLNWEQGLLVTPERLLTTTGSATSPKSFDRINVTLQNVTAACSQGLYLMNRRRGAGYQFGLDLAARNCIFMTGEESPLFDFVGVNDVERGDLHCAGASNRYPPRRDVTFLRYTTPPPNVLERTFDLQNRGTWSDESQPRPLEQFRMASATDRPAHEQSTESYAPPPNALIDAGFDPARLPSIEPLAPLSVQPPDPPATPPAPPAVPVGPPPDESSSLSVSPAESLP